MQPGESKDKPGQRAICNKSPGSHATDLLADHENRSRHALGKIITPGEVLQSNTGCIVRCTAQRTNDGSIFQGLLHGLLSLKVIFFALHQIVWLDFKYGQSSSRHIAPAV